MLNYPVNQHPPNLNRPNNRKKGVAKRRLSGSNSKVENRVATVVTKVANAAVKVDLVVVAVKAIKPLKVDTVAKADMVVANRSKASPPPTVSNHQQMLKPSR